MPSLPATVAETYRYVVGVVTHAATHSYAIVDDRGALLDQATFPTTPAGLRRARDWISRRTEGDLDSRSWSPPKAPAPTAQSSVTCWPRRATAWSKPRPRVVRGVAGRPTLSTQLSLPAPPW